MHIHAIEATLAKATARYRYSDIISKTFLIGQNQKSWDQENVFSGQSIRRFLPAMSTNTGLWAPEKRTQSSIEICFVKHNSLS